MLASEKQKHVVLLFSAFIIAICGLIYELLAGTLSSYLLGDSIYHFSLVIGIFMSAMGLGAWISRYIDNNLPSTFIHLQVLIGLIGGLSTTFLFFAFAIIHNYTPLLFLITSILGALLGIEIPLIIRILNKQTSLKLNVSNVFTADYIGALIAALLFPLVLVPQLGLMRTGLFFGVINIAVALLAWIIFKPELAKRMSLLASIIFSGIILIIGFIFSQQVTNHLESKLYQHQIIYAETTPYQRIVVTNYKQRTRFYINGALQFDSLDEYRYHESLVHPAMQMAPAHENILILGGGDGLTAREVLKYTDVKKITLVDLDPAVTQLFKDNTQLGKLNKDSLSDERLIIINQDAWKYLEHSDQLFDVVIIDLPDPSNLNLSRLYSTTFYTLLQQHLSHAGVIVTQASSPLYSREAFWSINETLKVSAGTAGSTDSADKGAWHTLPYHTYIPSFGEWGFILASRVNLEKIKLSNNTKPLKLRYLTPELLRSMQLFPPDMEPIEVEVNNIHSHKLLKYYQAGWAKWFN
ncbi:MAG: polyamine aminopropyltransferase [Thiotrichaceae bacterium]